MIPIGSHVSILSHHAKELFDTIRRVKRYILVGVVVALLEDMCH